MFVPLTNLDDRRWADLVDEARALIPVYSPVWTDHNAHDPGITLIELLAWIAETDIYRVNYIPDSHIRSFLALVGMCLLSPQPSHAAVVFQLKSGEATVTLPATTLLKSSAGMFSLRRDIDVLPAAPLSIQVSSSGRLRDATGDWQRGRLIRLFGDDPRPGDGLYIGFDQALDAGTQLSLYFELSGDRASRRERQRILDELADRQRSCSHVPSGCGTTPGDPEPAPTPELPPHHSAVIAWEVQTAPGVWQTIEAKDDTRSLTLSGSVVLPLPYVAAATGLGADARPFAYVRARLASGSFDKPPEAVRILSNAVEVEQCAPLFEHWVIATGVVAVGTPPLPGGAAHIYFDFDGMGRVTSLEFTSEAEDTLAVRMLDYQPATNAQEGKLTLEARRVGTGTGAPNQTSHLHEPQLCEGDFQLYTAEMGHLRKWRRRESLFASGPAAFDFVLDAGSASVQFGDGRNGRVPPPGGVVIAVGSETVGARGNVPAGAISKLDTGPHNTALLKKPSRVAAKFARIENVAAAADGTDAETIAHAQGRAALTLRKPSRAVTLADCEALALETPGASIARAAALANQHPEFPCYSAPGFITVVIVPELPAGRPLPSQGLLSAVSAYLGRRHVIGTRIVVVGPEYLVVSVNADVKAYPGQSKSAVRDAVTAALEKFFDPLRGGPEAEGWPLGRDVYISEVVEAIASAPGVDHVLTVELTTPGLGAQCGNVCLGPLALTVSGTHRIQVS